MFEAAVATAAIIRRQIPEAPEVALVLGSGLAGVAEAVKQPVTLRYADLPGFPEPSVAGHGGSLSLGRLAGRPVAVMQGRAHYYESGRADGMNLAFRSDAHTSPLLSLMRTSYAVLCWKQHQP